MCVCVRVYACSFLHICMRVSARASVCVYAVVLLKADGVNYDARRLLQYSCYVESCVLDTTNMSY